MPGADWFPGARAQLRRAHLPRPRRRTQSAIVHASERRELAELTWGELRDADGAHRRRPARARRRSRRPRRRLPAEHRRDGRRLPRLRLDRRDLVELLARLRRPQRRRPLRPDRAEGAARGRRLPLRRQATSTAGTVAAAPAGEIPSLEHTVVLALPRPGCEPRRTGDAMSWEQLLACGDADALAFERLPFDHPLWVLYSLGHDRACRRPSCTARAGSCSSTSRSCALHVDAAARRPALLVHDDRLDDVELPRRRPADGGRDRALRRQPRRARTWTCCGISPHARGVTCFGTSAAYIGACMKAGRGAGAAAATSRRCASSARPGSPLAPEGFDWVYEHVGDGHLALLDQRAAPTSAPPFVGGVPTLPVYAGELQARALGCDVEAWDEDGQPLVDEVGELVITEPHAVDAALLLERPRRRALPRELLRDVSRASGATATGSRSPRAAPRSSTGARTRRSTAAASAWARPRSTARCSPLDEVVDALVVDLPRRRHRGLDAAVRRAARGRRARRRARSAAIAHAHPRGLLAAPRAGRGHARSPAVPRTLSGKVLEVPVKRILMGQDPATAASRDSLADPSALDYFVQLQRDGL